MPEEDEKIKHVTPELAKELDRFAKEMLPVIEELIHDLEVMSNNEAKKPQGNSAPVHSPAS